MTNILNELSKEIAERESAFQTELERLGFSKLSSDYADIITIRQTFEILSRKSGSTIEAEQEPIQPENRDDENDGFVLADAVRNVINGFADKRFIVDDVVKAIEIEYQRRDIRGRKSSVSATLGNMANAGEIERVIVGKGGSPSVYRIRSNENQQVLLEEAKNGSDKVTAITEPNRI